MNSKTNAEGTQQARLARVLKVQRQENRRWGKKRINGGAKEVAGTIDWRDMKSQPKPRLSAKWGGEGGNGENPKVVKDIFEGK